MEAIVAWWLSVQSLPLGGSYGSVGVVAVIEWDALTCRVLFFGSMNFSGMRPGIMVQRCSRYDISSQIKG